MASLDNSRSRKHGIVSYSAHQFDPTSGQCFAELTVRARPKTVLSKLDKRNTYQNECGPSSLEAIAMRQFLHYIEDVTPETMHELTVLLSHLPWTIACKVWESARKMETLRSPLAVWRAFTEAYPQERGIIYHSASINDPYPDELPLYIERMSSDTFAWLTCLTVTSHFPRTAFRRADVINISQLRNLVAMDIGSSSIPANRYDLVDDSVVRAWSRHVEESQSFPALQVMIIRHQPGVTATSLTYLNSFPSLVLFGIQDCFDVRKDKEDFASSLGWTSRDDHGILAQMHKEMRHSQTCDAPLQACFKASRTLLRQTPLPVESAPILSFRLGHVPRDILFPNTFLPLVFFRCLRYTLPPSSSTQLVPILSPAAAAAAAAAALCHPATVQTLTNPSLPTAKRRKLKKHLNLDESFLSELMTDSAPETIGPSLDELPDRPRSGPVMLATDPAVAGGAIESQTGGVASAGGQEMQRRSASVATGAKEHSKSRSEAKVSMRYWEGAECKDE